MTPFEPALADTPARPLADLRARARILQRAVAMGADDARVRVRAHPELARATDAELALQVQRKHCLAVVAREVGFRDWSHACRVLGEGARAAPIADFGTMLYPHRCGGHWNIWSADYDEARGIRAEHGGFLLAYRHQFLIVEDNYIASLGLSPEDPDWEALGRDWVRPADPAARTRLYAKLLKVQ